jgi:hypothetical protein
MAPCRDLADELQDDSMLKSGTCAAGYMAQRDRTSAGSALGRSPSVDVSMRWLPRNDARLHGLLTEIATAKR